VIDERHVHANHATRADVQVPDFGIPITPAGRPTREPCASSSVADTFRESSS
jgi:hypothetical protein